MIILLCCVVLLVLGFLWILQGRTGHKGLHALRGWAYAHRGLHAENRPENSMAAFQAALEKGYGIELDLHLMKDGNLAVIHDASLLRTAGVDVTIENLTAEDLEAYRLQGTDEKIPLFSQVLQLIAGQVPMIIELKSTSDNPDAITAAAVKAMKGYEGVWCIESFDPRCVHSLKKNYPHVIRGQLSENFIRNKTVPISPLLKWSMALLTTNFLTKPDFVAYRFQDRKMLSNRLCHILWNVQEVSWTLRTQEQYDAAVAADCIPIFEHFCP